MGKVNPVRDRASSAALTIGQASSAAGLTPRAVRLYEARGLLSAPARSGAGYRLYTGRDVERLRFIAAARRLGLHVDQIAGILAAVRHGRTPCTTTRACLDRRIKEVDRVLGELGSLRASLVATRDAPVIEADDDSVICPIVESVARPSG